MIQDVRGRGGGGGVMRSNDAVKMTKGEGEENKIYGVLKMGNGKKNNKERLTCFFFIIILVYITTTYK